MKHGQIDNKLRDAVYDQLNDQFEDCFTYDDVARVSNGIYGKLEDPLGYELEYSLWQRLAEKFTDEA